MRAAFVEDLLLFQRVQTFVSAVFAHTRGFRRDLWLADQLNASAQSILANMAEGFRQPTDRAFARYLGISLASAEECRTHLMAAENRGHIAHRLCSDLMTEAREVANMLAGFIRYLHRCDRKNRLTTDNRS